MTNSFFSEHYNIKINLRLDLVTVKETTVGIWLLALWLPKTSSYWNFGVVTPNGDLNSGQKVQ